MFEFMYLQTIFFYFRLARVIRVTVGLKGEFYLLLCQLSSEFQDKLVAFKIKVL